MRDLQIIKSVLGGMGGWPMIDEHWDESRFDIETAIVESIKLRMSSSLLNILVDTDIKNTSNHVIMVVNIIFFIKSIMLLILRYGEL